MSSHCRMADFGSKPRAYSCYLCGAQFGSQSLLIHVKTCQKKWVSQQEQKPKEKRRPLPHPPPEIADPDNPSQIVSKSSGLKLPSKPADIDAFNARMIGYWDQVSLSVCPHCGRSFNEDAYDKHQKMCSADKPFKPLLNKTAGASGAPSTQGARPNAAMSLSATAPAGSLGGGSNSGPRSFTCYICGRGFMSRSLGIHLPQCLTKWEADEERRAPSERRKPPPPPEELADADNPAAIRKFRDGVAEGVLPSHPAEVEAFNARMASYFEKGSLAQCPNCGRTFNWESLERHKKTCTADNPMKSVAGKPSPPKLSTASSSGGSNESSPSATNSGGPRSYTCYLCGRGFMSNSLGIHLPQCLVKWLAEEERKPPGTQRAAPRPPLELADPSDPARIREFKDGVKEGVLPGKPAAIEAFNKKMQTYWNQASLCACDTCGRTFNWEALERHKKTCNADNPMKGPSGGPAVPSPSASANPAASSGPAPSGAATAGPKSYVCYLCGRGFMNRSLGIHLPQCLVKWTADESRKPPDAQRPPPLPPPELADPGDPSAIRKFKDGVQEGILPKRQDGIDAFNRRMTEHYDRNSLVACPTCHRTFHWEALQKHTKSCKPADHG